MVQDPDVIDRFAAWMRREEVRRYRLVGEAVLAVLYLLVAFLTTAGLGSVTVAAVSLPLMATGFLLYRTLPLLGLFVVGFGAILTLGAGWLGAPPPWIWLPVLVALFGSTAYGKPVSKWFGLAGVAIAGLSVSLVSGGVWFGTALWLPIWSIFFGAPWLAGLLWRTRKERTAARMTATAATERLDVARQEISLEQERNRVARDVHDIVAHSLAVVIAQADGARYAAKDASPDVTEALENIAATARGALTDVRVLLGELRHNQEAGPQPGIADLDALVAGFRESGLDVERRTLGEPAPLSEVTGLAVYRIVQEGLTNALRHGTRDEPTELALDWGGADLTITISNAIAADAPTSRDGHGLPGMRERVGLAGGELEAGAAGGRFRVRASLPIERPAVSATQPPPPTTEVLR